MNFPTFFNNIQSIKLKDELSSFLGTFENGIVEFTYLDVVKSAGHSCPTVAGAYLCVLEGLKELYKDDIPKRGDIYIEYNSDSSEGVTGVISMVMSQITGATETLGFKGLNGKFARHSLMDFNKDISSSVRFTRLDINSSVEVIYNPSDIQGDPKQNELMQKMIQGIASKDEKVLFGKLWQQRVESIFNNISKVITIK